MSKKWIILLFGLLVGGGFTFWSLQGFSWDSFANSLGNVDKVYLFFSALGFFCIPLVKAWRWEIILKPIKETSFKRLWPITTLGYASVMVLPFRLGEIVRPALLQKDYDVKFATGLSSILVERVFDLSSLVLILLASSFIRTLPGENDQKLYLAGAVTVFTILVMVFVYKKIPWFRRMITAQKTEKNGVKNKFLSFALNFLEGFAVVESVGTFVYIFCQSLLAWFVNAMAIYFLFVSFQLDLPFVAALYMLGFVLIAISIPTAPGFIGNFQAGCIWALSVFYVSEEIATNFAWGYYLWANGIKLILGFLALFMLKLSWSEIKNIFRFKAE